MDPPSKDNTSRVHWGRSENSAVTFFSDNVSNDSVESLYNNVPIGTDDEDAEEELTSHDKAYTTEIPDFYNPERMVYPGVSPYELSDEQFARVNHFDFLKSLHLKEPPLLPPYLNSNLLNDQPSRDYKKYPYQYQRSNVEYTNEQYGYYINKLGLMDRYGSIRSESPSPANSRQASTSTRPPLDRAASSQSSIKQIRQDLLKKKEPNDHSPLKHQDYIKAVEAERNLVPSHVMLNHLITCNLKIDQVIACSTIHRYSGKYITEIVYFPIEDVTK